MNPNIDSFIPFAKPSLDFREEEAVLEVLRSGWLTTGRQTFAFEREFADFIGSRFAVSLNSATAGLHLALEALGVSAGDAVITTPFTFTATAEVVRYLGADPLFVDIDPETLNIDPHRIETVVKKNPHRVKAVIPVHTGGLLCEMNSVTEIAKQYNLPVIEDAAHAFPLPSETGYAGTLGDIGVFSFYATKPITTGEGGMLVTDSESIAKRVSIMRLHGIDREVWNRYQSKGHTSWQYDITAPGYKYNMTDIAAAIGRVQLEKAQRFLKERKKIAHFYYEQLADCDFLNLPYRSAHHAWHLFIVALKPDTLTIERDEFVVELMKRGIGTSVHYIPLHLMSYYRNKYGFEPEDFPHAFSAYSSCFSIPIYPGLSEEDCHRIVCTVKEIGAEYGKQYSKQCDKGPS